MKKKLFVLCYIICLVCVGCGKAQPQADEVAVYKPVIEEAVPEHSDIEQEKPEDEEILPEETSDTESTAEVPDTIGSTEDQADGPDAEEVIEGPETDNLPEADEKSSYEHMAGIWVATVRNIDYPAEAVTDSAQLKREADAIIDNCAQVGINCIFLQVRPTCDAFYISSIFPWSKYLTGVQGTAPTDDFDPLQYWIAQAHARGMQLHAWINPYRVTRDNDAADTEYTTALSRDNPAVLHPEYLIKYENNYYFDPAIPEVRQLVLDGVREIVSGYDIDGIHFDDYFYPGTDFADDASFEKYGEGFEDKIEWRRDNVNKLVASVKPMIQSIKPDVAFGISPSGIWANDKSNALGSRTSGRESYTQLAADTRKWAIEGWVDYIAPQLYWSIGYEKADYQVLAHWWAEQLADCDTDLYIGIPDYRVTDSDPAREWHGESGVNQIIKQLELNDSIPRISGEIHYNYSSVFQNAALQEIYKNRYRK